MLISLVSLVLNVDRDMNLRRTDTGLLRIGLWVRSDSCSSEQLSDELGCSASLIHEAAYMEYTRSALTFFSEKLGSSA